MKCSPEESLKRRIAAELTEAIDTQRTTFELMTVIVLHDVFGFGRERLIKFGKALQKQYDDFSAECDITDTLRKNSPKATNFDTAIIRAVQALRSYGIDYHEILPNTAHIMISDGKGRSIDVDEFIREMERKG